MSCVFGPLGLGVWAPLSYNKVDKKPRAQPLGNLRGRVSRPGGKREGRTKHLSCVAPTLAYMCQKFGGHLFCITYRTLKLLALLQMTTVKDRTKGYVKN